VLESQQANVKLSLLEQTRMASRAQQVEAQESKCGSLQKLHEAVDLNQRLHTHGHPAVASNKLASMGISLHREPQQFLTETDPLSMAPFQASGQCNPCSLVTLPAPLQSEHTAPLVHCVCLLIEVECQGCPLSVSLCVCVWHERVFMCVYVWGKCLCTGVTVLVCVCVCVSAPLCAHVCVYESLCSRACVCLCVYLCICVYVCVCLRVYVRGALPIPTLNAACMYSKVQRALKLCFSS
jgi:hypothetical protein